MRKTKIGFLPLYVELYDLTVPELRPDVDAFCGEVRMALERQGLDLVAGGVCRLKREFEKAVDRFMEADVDAVVTLHLAYSPSLESEQALRRLNCPILVLDTTPDYCFDQSTDVERIMRNHGIHGVQDMCNLLRRNRKIYSVFAGHIRHSDVLERVRKAAEAAKAAKAFRRARVGLIGEPFSGMGDFRVSQSGLEKLGIHVVPYDWEKGAELMSRVTQDEIDAEFAGDCERFEIDPTLDRAVYDRAARTGLGIRKWAREEELTAFTINFLATEGARPGLPVMPFVECSKAMARGIGYAGEGDVITAALVGGLLQAYPRTTFSEMFCPDWKNSSVFLSHMGEYNYAVSGKPYLTEKEFGFTDAENPTVAYGTMQGGPAVLANLAPLSDGSFAILFHAGKMMEIEGKNELANAVNGWFQPDGGLEPFLERYSELGGTHHNLLVYGQALEELQYFAKYCGIDAVVV